MVQNAVLALGHALNVFGKRDHLALLGGIEKQQVRQHIGLLTAAGVNAELQAAAEILEELLVRFAIVIAHGVQLGLDLFLDLASNSAQLAILLQRFAGNVQRKVLTVHNAAHEVEVIRNQVLALLHD